MDIHFWILVSGIRQISKKCTRTKVEFTLKGVDIIRLSTLGVWRCLRNVDEVIVHVFFLCHFERKQ